MVKNKKTKFLKIAVLLLLLMIVNMIYSNTANAATYSSKFVSISIPDKYEKYYEYIDEESEWVSYMTNSYGESTIIHHNIFENSYVEFKQSYLDEYVASIEEIAAKSDYEIKFFYKDLVEINGCKGMRIAYEEYLREYDVYWCYDEYFFLTDNYEAELRFTSTNPKFIDSQEEKAIVKSFRIKDTVLKSRGIPFTDVATNTWYFDAVKYVYENNMIKGMNDYTFNPNGNLTRGMLVTILWRMEGSPKATTNQFTDVSTKSWYYDAVNWAAANKIVNGYGEGKFGPEDNITREQLAVILKNYAGVYKKKNVSARADLNKFKDNASIASYAKDGVSWAVANKIISGKENGTKVDPKGKATRAEAAAMLRTYCLNVK